MFMFGCIYPAPFPEGLFPRFCGEYTVGLPPLSPLPEGKGELYTIAVPCNERSVLFNRLPSITIRPHAFPLPFREGGQGGRPTVAPAATSRRSRPPISAGA